MVYKSIDFNLLLYSLLSTSVVSNSDLMKHLSVTHASTKLTLAKNSVANAVDDTSRPGVANVSSTNSLLAKYWGEQEPVHHAEIHFLNICRC